MMSLAKAATTTDVCLVSRTLEPYYNFLGGQQGFETPALLQPFRQLVMAVRFKWVASSWRSQIADQTVNYMCQLWQETSED